MKRILPNELGSSKALAEKIRANIPLVLLLDGLDEVPEADRNSCLEALGQYGVKPGHQFALSSRIEEYAKAKDAPVYGQVEVAPLTATQIEQNLLAYSGLTPEAKPLLNAIQKDPLLKQAIENPFYLNTAQLLFASGKNWSEFGFVAGDVAGRQKELVERFIRWALTHKMKRYYIPEKIEKWLGFLAEKMEKEKLRVFELVDLASFSSWLIWVFKVVGNATLIALTIGVLSNGNYSLAEYVLFALFCVFLLVAIAVLIGVYYLKKVIFDNWNEEKEDTSFLKFVGYIFSTLILLLIFPWLIDKDVVKNKYPYQKFFSKAELLRLGLLHHLIFRFLFYSNSSLPLRLVHFLNEMSRRHLLEFDGNLDTETGGGSWRWRHRIIQEHFLTMNDERVTMNE